MTLYCGISDVKNCFRKLDTAAASAVKDSDIEQIISEQSDYIDTVIAHVYRTPVLAQKSLNIVKMICRYLSAAEVFSILNRSSASPIKEDDVAFDEFKMTQGKELLDGIKENKNLLDETDMLESFANSDSTDAFADKVRVPRTYRFYRDKVQW